MGSEMGTLEPLESLEEGGNGENIDSILRDLEKPLEKDDKTPEEKEVDKFVNILKNEGISPTGLSVDKLGGKLVQSGFMKVENNRMITTDKPYSNMVRDAYKEAVKIRRKRIAEEKEKVSSVIDKYKGDTAPLEKDMVRQGILIRKKNGTLVPNKGKAFEYAGYRQALKEYKEAN